MKRPEGFFSGAGQRIMDSSIRKSNDQRLRMPKAVSILSRISLRGRATQRSQASEFGGAEMVKPCWLVAVRGTPPRWQRRSKSRLYSAQVFPTEPRTANSFRAASASQGSQNPASRAEMMISRVSLAVWLSNSSGVLPDAHVAPASSRTENIAVTMLIGAAVER